MEYTKLPNTNLNISRLGFGCEPLGGTDWGKVDKELAIAAVSRAVELGINFFDTADIYGLGRSERLLAKALGGRRHEVIIASKFGVNWEAGSQGGRAKVWYDSSPGRVVQALENSLKRLQIDCIPLYQIHWPDPHTPFAETLAALLKCREAGKIRYIGVSNFSAAMIQELQTMTNLATAQLPYNLIDRRAEEDLLPCCQELGLGVLAYGTLAQGLLSGKYDSQTKFPEDDRRHRLPGFQKEALLENIKIVDRLKYMGGFYQKSPAQVAIRWVLDNPTVHCAIVGAKSPAQVEHNTNALDWRLSETDWHSISSIKPSIGYKISKSFSEV